MRAEAGCQHVDGDPPPPLRCGHFMFLSTGQAGYLCFPQVADVLGWGQKIVLEVVWHHLLHMVRNKSLVFGEKRASFD